jgi:protein-tyrosine phosphatase
MHFKSVLMVCVGNVCRSPLAEHLLRSKLSPGSGVTVASAGLRPPMGSPVHPIVEEKLQSRGLTAAGHRARQVNPELLLQHDVVLVMEPAHIELLHSIEPLARGRIFLLDHWGEQQPIPDPVRQQREAFDHVDQLIDQATSAWLSYLDTPVNE